MIRTLTVQEQWIEKARGIHQPSPVELDHVPQWMVKRVTDFMRLLGVRTRYYGSLHDACTRMGICCDWLDHWGSTTLLPRRRAFVSEPYLKPRDVTQAATFATATATWLIIDPNSWWYPGHTTRLVFIEPEPDCEEAKLKERDALAAKIKAK